MTYKPDIVWQMKQIINLDVVKPHLWAKTFEASGITEEMVAKARDEEMLRRIRNAEEVTDE